jgi:2,4-dichlorophenol 6-monooxygenase
MSAPPATDGRGGTGVRDVLDPPDAGGAPDVPDAGDTPDAGDVLDRLDVPDVVDVRDALDVLIVGAGPAGMLAALCLARLGIRSRIVERNAAPSIHPKAHEVNARSMEILTQLGFDEETLAAEAAPPSDGTRILFCKTIGEEFGGIDLCEGERAAKYQRHLRLARPYLNLSQTELEKTILARVGETPETALHFGHQWEHLEQDADGVTSRVRDLATGRACEIRSAYVIAADGAASRVRKCLGIAMDGPEKIQDFVNAHFETSLRHLIKTPAKLYWILEPAAPGAFIAHHIDRRWVYNIPLFTPYEQPEDYTAEALAERIRTALGPGAPRIEITSTSLWRMTMQVARAYRQDRVFLVGDAAHRFPPTGGLGMNTGIADAHNLAWKLAAVLKGEASPALLDTYESERRPVAELNGEESRVNYERLFEVMEAFGLDRSMLERVTVTLRRAPARWLPRWAKDLAWRLLRIPANLALRRYHTKPETRRRVLDAIARQVPHFDRIGLDIGYCYERGAVVSDGTRAPVPDDPVTQYIPSASPGARLPHVWLDPERRSHSSHDLIDFERYVLVVGSDGSAWAAAAGALGLRVPLRVLSIDELSGTAAGRTPFRSLLEIGAAGAILLRPDGHVAWRTKDGPKAPADAAESLRDVFRRLHAR